MPSVRWVALVSLLGFCLTAVASAAASYQPDLWMMKKNGYEIIGSDVHNDTGIGQTTTWRLRAGAQVSYRLWLENDGTGRDAFTWTGTASDANFTITYYSQSGAGEDLTPQVTGAGFTTRELGPGISKVVHFVIRANPGAPVGAERLFVIRLTSTRKNTISDVVRVRAKIRESTTSLQLTGVAGLPTRAGAQVTFALSAPARVSARVLNLAGRPVATLGLPRDYAPGANALLWNARDSGGLAVPSGIYLIELTARTTQGTEARAVATLSVRR
ncbi:MAG: hypothetical protein FJX75_09440 [Armatimonadetes bacterium]|nr:hypothetical protein [Armatimonadota bacterium]